MQICELSASELARLIRAGELSAREVVSAHLDRIDDVNSSLNAIVTLVADSAMDAARQADARQAAGRVLGPLHGLPTAHKDLQPAKGIRTTFGSPIFSDFIPSESSLLVERLQAAGAITVGKTNTPEFGAGSQTFNRIFGATRNPYDPTKTCGGSSGGAAVAVAACMLPIADGSDMGGSLRNPASFCNVVGMRPSPGRVPVWPALLGWSTLSVEGPIARDAQDAALLLSAMAGPDARSPIALGDPGSIFAAPIDREFSGVRVAWWKGLNGLPVEKRVRDVVDGQRGTFESLGCRVDAAEPDLSDADEIFKTLRAYTFAAGIGSVVSAHRHQVKDTILWEVDRGLRLSAEDAGRAEVRRTELYHRMRLFMQEYEFFVLPTVQVAPFDVEQAFVTEIEGTRMETYIDWMKSCYYITVTGHPAVSVPAGFTDGLPVGLQIVGRHRDDWGVLQMAHAFETARGVLQPSGLSSSSWSRALNGGDTRARSHRSYVPTRPASN